MEINTLYKLLLFDKAYIYIGALYIECRYIKIHAYKLFIVYVDIYSFTRIQNRLPILLERGCRCGIRSMDWTPETPGALDYRERLLWSRKSMPLSLY
jgi:hypothetical protein